MAGLPAELDGFTAISFGCASHSEDPICYNGR
jgi:hypothetical protein